MIIDIVCPVYKPNDLFYKLVEDIRKQENVTINKIVCPITVNSLDEDTTYFEEVNIVFFKVLKKDFSHSLTREKAIREYCESNIVVLLTQDIVLLDNYTLYNLCKSIESNETVFNYARQICKSKSIEGYAREKNYPNKSFVLDNSNITFASFFASDACSALNREVFIKLDGYQHIDLMMNEDQLYSFMVLINGYKKGYIAEAVVEHSHNFSLRQLFLRYYASGVSFHKIPFLYHYGVYVTGSSLAKFILRRAIEDKNIKAILMWPFDMAARFIGLKLGKMRKK